MCQVMIVKYWTRGATYTFLTWAARHGWVQMNDPDTVNDEGQYVLVMGRNNHSYSEDAAGAIIGALVRNRH